jgi:yecA family protein
MTSTPTNDADAAIEYEQLDALVQRLHIGTTASELHGSLCGYLAGGGKVTGNSLVAQLQLDGEGGAPPAAEQALLEQLVQQCATALADPEMGFAPMLPADDRPLDERAEATAEWCRGFLGGFGLTGASTHAKLTDEAQEMLHDLGAIASSSFDYGDENEDEDALIEVQEFIRVGAMLLHAECSIRDRPASGTVH